MSDCGIYGDKKWKRSVARAAITRLERELDEINEELHNITRQRRALDEDEKELQQRRERTDCALTNAKVEKELAEQGLH